MGTCIIEKNIFILPEALFIENASELKAELLNYLNRNLKNYVIDLTNLEEADLSIIQLFISFAKESIKRSLVVTFKGPLKEDFKSKLIFSDYINDETDDLILFNKLNQGGFKIEC